MDIYYLINDKKYMDTYLLREKLELNKSQLQQVMKVYQFPQSEVVNIQNKKLYSLNGLNEFIEMILESNEG